MLGASVIIKRRVMDRVGPLPRLALIIDNLPTVH
jgi:hypothetical protein